MIVATIGEIHEEGLKLLTNDRFTIVPIKDTSSKNLKIQLKDVDAIAIRTSELFSDVLSECINLKIVSRHGVGTDNVDIKYLNKRKIPLAITGTANAVSVSEHVLTLMLNLSRKIKDFDNYVRSGGFEDQSSILKTYEIYKKNILILGFGRIGKALQKRCRGFDMNVLVYDPYVSHEIISDLGCTKVDLLEGIKQADFISIHMPLTNDTKNLISRSLLKEMKQNCILINTARGGIVNQEDLVWALNSNIIAGAGLDVYTNEPPDKLDPIFRTSNTILTPHNSALTLECRKRMAIETCENIVYYLFDREKLNDKNIINRNNLNL